MNSTDDTGADRDEHAGKAGSSTDQHITGAPETGAFPTDKAPTSDTPAGGSSNAGINARAANRAGSADAGQSVPADG